MKKEKGRKNLMSVKKWKMAKRRDLGVILDQSD
jgi:hypothetical protein